jgi:hypothetical protein
MSVAICGTTFGMRDSDLISVEQDLRACLEATASANQRLQDLLQDSAATAADYAAVHLELTRLNAERGRLMAALQRGRDVRDGGTPRGRGAADGRPLRELVLDVVDAVGVPVAPRVVADYGQARFGVRIPAGRLASLRRDERRAFDADPASRPAFLAPALLADTLTAVPRLVTSSAWPLERRIIGPRSLRVNHLKTLLAVCDAAELLAGRDDRGHTGLLGMQRMGAGLARTVPGALVDASFDPARARAAAREELAVIEEADAADRQQAAARAERRPLVHRVWGGPAVIPGGTEAGSSRA